jgi:predicted methyltransferase
MTPRARALLLGAQAVLLAGCVTAARTPTPAVRSDEQTAAAIERVLADSRRSQEHRARDAARHPLDTLLFFGITPEMTVAEIWPGADGWYTEVLAPLLAGHGKLYSAQLPSAPGNDYSAAVRAQFTSMLAARPELFSGVTVTTLGPDGGEVAPADSCDLVVSFRGLHSWMRFGYAPQALASIWRALKPGGILGIVDNRGDPSVPQDPLATRGYVREDYAISLIEAAGFELVARSDINANPRDTRDYAQGVWALPPDYRQGNRDREQFQAIGESDRFTLKFRKK